MKPVKIILCALSLLVAPLTVSWADSPEYINYQGLLNGADGQPLPTGSYTMEFNIYDQANLGAKQWGPFLFDGVAGDGHGPEVPVVNGRFNVIIGPLDTNGDSIINAFDTDTRFVEITVNGAPILPRQQFLSTPYAFSIPNVTPNPSGVDIAGDTTVSGTLTVDASFSAGQISTGGRVMPSSIEFWTGSPNPLKGGLFRQGGTGSWLGSSSAVDGDIVLSANSGKLHLQRGTGASAITIDTANRVGVGTSTPTQAKLVVNGSVSGTAAGDNGFAYDLVSFSGRGVNRITDTVGDVVLYSFSGDLGSNPRPATSIYATHAIWSGTALVSSSDERIKNIQGRSDGAKDLDTLRGIEVADYRYKDVIGKGNAPQKKVIAQQVEKVYPLAVSQQTDSVPDIYQIAATKDGWVELATDLKKGDRVKLIAEKEEGIHEVMEVAEGKFRTDFQSEDEKVFVYGREVNDFRTVDYDAISMLNVSATQELARRLEAQEAQLAAKEAELAQLREENDKLTRKVTVLESRDQLLEERLTRLERKASSDVQLTGLKIQSDSAE